MSVQTQIDRISGAVQSALAALTEKGVTVPDGTKVDDLSTLIATIESGGGGLWGFDYFTGSFTPSEDIIDSYTVETGYVARNLTEASSVAFLLFDTTQSNSETSTSLKRLKGCVSSYFLLYTRPGVVQPCTLSYYKNLTYASELATQQVSTYYVPYPTTYPINVDFPFSLPSGIRFKAGVKYAWLLVTGIS